MLGETVPGWDRALDLAFATCAAAVAIFGITSMMKRNIDLIRAHEENADLLVENERTRFARDLHDILGHSLTVITVKAELAGRLMDADPARAKAEVADLERLSRDALADVRRAVEGYRDLTLPGELARARAALRSGRDPGRPAEHHRRRADRPARAVRLDGPRGGHQRDPALRHARTCRVTLEPRPPSRSRDDGDGASGETGGRAAPG